MDPPNSNAKCRCCFCSTPARLRDISLLAEQAVSGRLGWSLFSRGQPYNVVLTHLSADFDSLAAAVGVAKLWNMHDPEVCAPALFLSRR